MAKETKNPVEELVKPSVLDNLRSRFDSVVKPRGSNDNAYDQWGDDDDD